MIAHTEDLFVVRDNCKHIEVYDTNAFELKSALKSQLEPDLRSTTVSLASCVTNNCLFVGTERRIHRFALYGSRQEDYVLKGGTKALAVSMQRHLLALVYDSNRAKYSLVEYTSRLSYVGEKLIEANLSELMLGNWHHVLLVHTGEFIVSHSEPSQPLHRVSWINDAQQVRFHYGDKPGAGPGHLDEPRQVAFDSKLNTFVADLKNNRILVLNPWQNLVQVLPINVAGGLEDPFALWLDEIRGRLYVSESSGQFRLLVFDNIYSCITGSFQRLALAGPEPPDTHTWRSTTADAS